jgi:serine/threonine protein kinase
MNYLHSRGIVHRDLKPANIFVGHGLTMKIGDFGMARYAVRPVQPAEQQQHPPIFRPSPGVIGTPHYAAPELINDTLRPQDQENPDWAFKIDIWSFGITLWEILERKRPFEGQSAIGMQTLWINSPYQSRLPPVRVPEHLDATNKRVLRGLADLVEECTRVDPMTRPSFDEILRRLRVLVDIQLAPH